MADPSISLFQGGGIEIDNPQSREEDEDLEEHKRRQAELTDLLATGIGAFNYDESTMDSSTTSFEAPEQPSKDTVEKSLQFKYDRPSHSNLEFNGSATDSILHQNYIESRPQDQLKILYEVRVRELSSLKEEFVKYQTEKEKEVDLLKNKLTLSEAEIRHLQLSATNIESLLVEKTEIINTLKQDNFGKDTEIGNLKKQVEQLSREICSYSSTVNELQLKLADNNPFGIRNSKSGQIEKSHQDQIVKLETLLQEQTAKCDILEKENGHLKEDIRKLAKTMNENDEENNETIRRLSKKLEASHQQCKDLFLLGEAIKKESDHFKERMLQLESNKLDLSGDSFKVKSMAKDVLIVHVEKLKRMLLDRDIEINSLQAKLKFYDSDIDELFEYRKLLNDIYNCAIKPCGNSEHAELLVFMQRQLQSYQQAVEDRNQQITNLNVINKEFQEKIEEMIQQARTDIQNLSEKYSLPQLESMNKELENAELKIYELTKITELGANEKKDLLEKLKKAEEEIMTLQKLSDNERQNFDEMLNLLKGDLERSENEIKDLKQVVEDLKTENVKVKTNLIQQSDSDENRDDLSIKNKCGQVQDQLQRVAEKLEKMSAEQEFNDVIKFVTTFSKKIENLLNNLCNVDRVKEAELIEILTEWHSSFVNLLESINNFNSSSLFNFKSEEIALKEKIDGLADCKTMLEGEKIALEHQVKSLVQQLGDTKKETEDKLVVIQNLQEDLSKFKANLDISEMKKTELEIELGKCEEHLLEAKQQIIDLQKEIQFMNSNIVKRNLFKELEDVEKILEKSSSGSDVLGTDLFQKCLQGEVLKAELQLRDTLQEENGREIKKIEEQYKNMLAKKCDSFNNEKQKWKKQEATYRKQFSAILEDCSKKMLVMEQENVKLIEQAESVVKEFEDYKRRVFVAVEKYQNIIFESRAEHEKVKKKWEELLLSVITNYSTLAKESVKKRTSIVKKISTSQSQIDLIQKKYDEKIKKMKQKSENVPIRDYFKD